MGGKPGSPCHAVPFVVNHLVNPIVARLGGTVVLTVRCRRSGVPITVPLGRPFAPDGVQYLVSGAGVTNWARNLRAAGSGELRLHGTSEPFRAVEIEPGPEHDRIIAAYRQTQGRTVAGFFQAIPNPADHPVFRVDRIEAPH
jgi:hypothetical protein